MGQSKGGGWDKKATVSPEQLTMLQNMMKQAFPQMQESAEGYRSILSGEGTKAIGDEAQRKFQQQTIPQIMTAFGSGSKSSSALNQALAAGGADLNSSLSSSLAKMKLGAAQGMGNLATSQAQIGAQTPQFDYMQRQTPYWQQALLASISGGSQIASSALKGAEV